MNENLLEEKIAQASKDYDEKLGKRKITGKSDRRRRLYNKNKHK